jgi:hypothetical protein
MCNKSIIFVICFWIGIIIIPYLIGRIARLVGFYDEDFPCWFNGLQILLIGLSIFLISAILIILSIKAAYFFCN